MYGAKKPTWNSPQTPASSECTEFTFDLQTGKPILAHCAVRGGAYAPSPYGHPRGHFATSSAAFVVSSVSAVPLGDPLLGWALFVFFPRCRYRVWCLLLSGCGHRGEGLVWVLVWRSVRANRASWAGASPLRPQGGSPPPLFAANCKVYPPFLVNAPYLLLLLSCRTNA